MGLAKILHQEEINLESDVSLEILAIMWTHNKPIQYNDYNAIYFHFMLTMDQTINVKPYQSLL